MKPSIRRLTQWSLASLGAMACSLALAQTYPTKPITLVVPFAAGGPTDIVARTLASTMGKTLGQTVVVENKVGAGGTLAAGYVAKANPDGYTFLIHHNGMSTAPALYRKMAFNPLTDFEYVSQAVDVPMTLLGRKDLPARNMQELSTYVKANAKSINLANAGLGAVSHLCGMLFQQAMGADLTTVPFSGTAPALNAPALVAATNSAPVLARWYCMRETRDSDSQAWPATMPEGMPTQEAMMCIKAGKRRGDWLAAAASVWKAKTIRASPVRTAKGSP